MKILDVMKKIALPAVGLIAGTVLATKSTDALSSCFSKNPFEDKSVEIEEHEDGSFTVKESEETE